MAEQQVVDWAGSDRPGVRAGAAPEMGVRMVGALLGVGPFIGYVASRSVGVPGDHGDVGNWGYWVGTVSLVIEAALIVLGVTMLIAYRQRSRHPLVVGWLGQLAKPASS
jgi:hypothetical protein